MFPFELETRLYYFSITSSLDELSNCVRKSICDSHLSKVSGPGDVNFDITFEHDCSYNFDMTTKNTVASLLHKVVPLNFSRNLFDQNFVSLICSVSHQLALVPTCLGGRFGINCPSAFWKSLKLPQ